MTAIETSKQEGYVLLIIETEKKIMYMIRGHGGWWSSSVLLDETVDTVLRSLIVRYNLKDIGKTEESLL